MLLHQYPPTHINIISQSIVGQTNNKTIVIFMIKKMSQSILALTLEA